MLRKIISGGQTGADRAALDAALEAGFPSGGSCPAGRIAEDGPIPRRYSLTELKGGYRERTRQNVEDSDGTVVFYHRYLQGGTEQTVADCIRSGKPCKLLDIDVVTSEQALDNVILFIQDFDIANLNVAGPRQSECPGIYDYVKTIISLLITIP